MKTYFISAESPNMKVKAQIELLRIMNEEGAIDSDTREKYVNRIANSGIALEESEIVCELCDGTGEIRSHNFFPSNPGIIDEPYGTCPQCNGSGRL